MMKPKTILSVDGVALPIAKCLAKTCQLIDGTKVPGVNVSAHCQTVGLVARELIARMPDFLRLGLFPEGSELVAAVHDLGKVSPPFQKKIYENLDQINEDVMTILGTVDTKEDWGGHAGTSQAALDGVGKFIAEIAGRHHGSSPSLPPLPLDQKIGGKAWQEKRMELLGTLKNSLGVEFPKVQNAMHANVLAGLTTVADWIGSGHFFDRLRPDGTPNAPWNSNIDKAVDKSGFVPPKIRPDLTFTDIFEFEPRNAQIRLIEAVAKPGVYVLEAPMGLGKTEAALYAAYQALAEGRATGIYFALPTQLTSNKIHDRMTSFLRQILDSDCVHRRALLLHGSAWLCETEMGEEGQPGHSWFDSSKRGLLAPFAVGTIDQALMAVMNVKHGFVRTFGLAGKVVILDEVHTYDSYTGTIMDHLIATLQELHCTVIILSATLTKERRQVLMGLEQSESKSEEYPLISAKPKDDVLQELAVEKAPDHPFLIQMQKDQDVAIEMAMDRACQGQQVLWIENTVGEAQEIYKKFAARALDVEVGLLHSRFLKIHREANEGVWVSKFGKPGRENRYDSGRILVGTQVLEQSLDIDADFLVTRICPTDMLFQRLGRLWRHRENDSIRPSTAQCEAWILSPTLDDAINHSKDTLGKSAMVYSPYVLSRTIEVWDSLNRVQLPSQIRPLLEATYCERAEEGQMASFKHQLSKEREKLSRLALVGLSALGKTLPESKATTRHSEQESCEVLILKSFENSPNGMQIQFLDGTTALLETNAKAKNATLWRKVAADIARNTVNIPVYHAPKPTGVQKIKALGEYVYLGKADEESALRIALLGDDLELGALGGGLASEQFYLEYRNDYGYVAKKTTTENSTEEGW